MTKIELEIHDDLISALNKIKDINDEGIELEIPEGSVIFDNILNLKLLEKEAEQIGKTIHFKTFDEAGLNLISFLDEESATTGIMDDGPYEENSTVETSQKSRLPKIAIPKVHIPLKIPNIKLSKPVLIGIAAVAILAGVYFFGANSPEANVKIIMNPEPLTKSISLKVKKDAATSAESKILKGISVEAETTQTMEAETTGEKLVGEKAEGKVKIYNFTSADKTLKKGTELSYDDFKFTLDGEVTIPAQTVDPVTLVATRGEAEGDVTATEIGEDYNISKDKSLSVKGYKTNEVAATSTSGFTGGESKTVKVVAATDLTGLSSKALTANQEQGQTALAAKVGSGQKYINGSGKSVVVTENFDAKENDEKDKVTIIQTIKTTGLVYPTQDIENVLDDLVKGFVPEGFTTSTEDRTVNVEVLGNSDVSVLNSEEADLQVTLKTFVVPDIDKDKLKEELAGKSISEAEKVLGSIRNIKTYELNLVHAIPLFQRMPGKADKINVDFQINEK